MNVQEAPLPGVLLVRTPVFQDARGHFRESWSRRGYAEAGIDLPFVQDNVSLSTRNVIRGLHFQHPHGQAKLISVLEGAIWDVSVDVRVGSDTFGQWFGMDISADAGIQIFIPAGFAHGLAVLSDRALVSYKCADYYAPDAERTVLWDDPELGIEWPVKEPLLSEKDRAGVLLRDMPESNLPRLG